MDHSLKVLVTLLAMSLLASSGTAQLTANFYSTSCPTLLTIVRNAMTQAVNSENRMAASILRLFFHDCFVNGCDGSLLLDDTATFTGEKNAGPNANSVRGFEIIDTIKTRVEAACNATVSCADILALAARDGVVLVGGPTWAVPLGRRDARTASQSAANAQIPAPGSSLGTITNFYNDTNIDAAFATTRRGNCPQAGAGANLAPLDNTPTQFDNRYYQDLVARRGLLHSDQELFNNGTQDALVRTYSTNAATFASDFAAAMIRMGNLSPLTGANGEIRRNCRRPN
ncbi:Peroxidase 52 [Linum perenne]